MSSSDPSVKDPGAPLIAALPMYDWPEERGYSDAVWRAWRDVLREAGVPAPDALTRRNAALPSMPGGIRDAAGVAIAADPASLPPDPLDVEVLWRHPRLLLAQTCWGPLLAGLAPHVHVLAQPDYTAFAGGDGIHYRSALIMRGAPADDVPPPRAAQPAVPVADLRGLRLARSVAASMSGEIALSEDLAALGVDEQALWSEVSYSGNHRNSVRAVAGGRADVAAIDCRSFDLARRHEPAAREVRVVGWTAPRPGLPLVASRRLSQESIDTLRRVLAVQPGLHGVEAAAC